jgi:4'-phosphopantetheinyl transferase
VGPGRDGEPDFSVAHTTGRALVAISERGAVGVDIEPVQEHRDPLGLARRFFAPDDNRYLAGLPADQVDLAFSRMWCRKEAFLKLTGHGLSGGMAAVPTPGARWDGPVTDARGLADAPVHVTDIDPGIGYVAAVARSV